MPNVEHIKVYFYDYSIREVTLVWGINGWKTVPEVEWPENTQLNKNGILRTAMKNMGHYFVADLKIPADSDLNYGFDIEETESGFPIQWTAATRFNSIIVKKHRLKPLLKFWAWITIQRGKRLHRKFALDRYETVDPIRWRKTNYTRFIVLAAARTGSTMLVSMLESHPHIQMYGELFHVHKVDPFKSAVAKPNRKNATVEYLNQHIFRPYLGRVKAVGFKLLYGHDKWVWRFVWLYLQHSRVRVIHLKRRNLLARHLSYELAKRSNLWLAGEDQASNRKYEEPIRLDPEEAMQNIKLMVERQAKYAAVFNDNPVIDVAYEDLVATPREASQPLLKFLGLPEVDLNSQSIKKQRKKKMSEVIGNYDELKAAFEAAVESCEIEPEWLRFFDE